MGGKGARELVERLLAGEAMALARAISWIEDEDERGFEVLDAVYPKVSGSYRIGISGPPGAGMDWWGNEIGAGDVADSSAGGGTRIGIR